MPKGIPAYNFKPEQVGPERLVSALLTTETDVETAINRVCEEGFGDLSKEELKAAREKFTQERMPELLNEEFGEYEVAKEEIGEALYKVIESSFRDFVGVLEEQGPDGESGEETASDS